MVRFKHILLTGFVVLIGVLIIFYLLPNEEKRVRKRFDLLSQYIAKELGEDLISTVNRVKNTGKLFADPCEFKIEGDPFYAFSGNYSREEVFNYVLRGRTYFSNLSLKFYDLKVDFLEKGTAKANLTARLTGKSAAGETVDEVRELICVLKKIEKQWLFSQFEVVQILKK